MHDQSYRKFGPKDADDHSIGEVCPACRVAFVEGDFTTLVALGPGADSESRKRARQGRAYNAIAVQVHYACATGDET